MANPKRGEVEIELGGETHTLRYTFNALSTLDSILGFPVTQIHQQLGPRTVAFAISAGLQHEGTKLDSIKVGKLLEKEIKEGSHDFNYYAVKVVEAISLALGFKPEEAEGSGEAAESQE